MNVDDNLKERRHPGSSKSYVQESQAIDAAAKRLDGKSFTKALDLLVGTSHKVVVTGIGKSGHVGKKICNIEQCGNPSSIFTSIRSSAWRSWNSPGW